MIQPIDFFFLFRGIYYIKQHTIGKQEIKLNQSIYFAFFATFFEMPLDYKKGCHISHIEIWRSSLQKTGAKINFCRKLWVRALSNLIGCGHFSKRCQHSRMRKSRTFYDDLMLNYRHCFKSIDIICNLQGLWIMK